MALMKAMVVTKLRSGPALLEHRAEKWKPVFRKNDATTKAWSGERDSEIALAALGSVEIQDSHWR
jgi:hypothetical protein